MPRIAAILIYPVGGCRGVRVKSCGLSARGLEGDRRWKLIEADGAPVAQEPALARVWVEQKGPALWLVAAGMDRLPLADESLAGAWCSKLLGRPVRCLQDDGPAPLLATTTASLAALNQALPQSVGVELFGPNLVLEGTDPFAEDGWAAVKVGGVRFLASPHPHRLRTPFGVTLTPQLAGAAPASLRAGQGLDVELS